MKGKTTLAEISPEQASAKLQPDLACIAAHVDQAEAIGNAHQQCATQGVPHLTSVMPEVPSLRRPQLPVKSMSARMKYVLDPDQQEILDQVRSRHPSRSSACGALLSEIASTSIDLESRVRAARLYGDLSCKRGLGTLNRVSRTLCSEIVGELSETEDFPTGVKRYFFSALLSAIARMDRPDSHALLVRYLFSIQNPHLRADVLEAMAFEVRMFDVDLVLRILEKECDEPMILSGLYALSFPGANIDSEDVQGRVSPFLRHQSDSVRAYTVRLLSYCVENRELIQKLSDDPDGEVRESVRDALYQMDRYGS